MTSALVAYARTSEVPSVADVRLGHVRAQRPGVVTLRPTVVGWAYRRRMLETVGPQDECPHVFVPGTAARARASLAEWPSRAADARCAWCGRLVDLRPWALSPEPAPSDRRVGP